MLGGSSRSSPQPASRPRPPSPSWRPVWTLSSRGPDWTPITPKPGSLFHADLHATSWLLLATLPTMLLLRTSDLGSFVSLLRGLSAVAYVHWSSVHHRRLNVF